MISDFRKKYLLGWGSNPRKWDKTWRNMWQWKPGRNRIVELRIFDFSTLFEFFMLLGIYNFANRMDLCYISSFTGFLLCMKPVGCLYFSYQAPLSSITMSWKANLTNHWEKSFGSFYAELLSHLRLCLSLVAI